MLQAQVNLLGAISTVRRDNQHEIAQRPERSTIACRQ
jgi:hypothetical protein